MINTSDLLKEDVNLYSHDSDNTTKPQWSNITDKNAKEETHGILWWDW